MFIKNKKFVVGLILLTIFTGALFSGKNRAISPQPALITEQEVQDFTSSFNQSLPIRINEDMSLIKTQIGAINKSLYSVDFFYAYYKNKADIKNFDQLTQSMIFQTCKNETTMSLLKRDVLLRHQFITLDKQKLPYIGVSLPDCKMIIQDITSTVSPTIIKDMTIKDITKEKP